MDKREKIEDQPGGGLLEFWTIKHNRVVIDAKEICGLRADRTRTVIYLKSGQRPHVSEKLKEVQKKWEDAVEAIRTEHAKTQVDRFLDRLDRCMVELPQGQPLNPLGDYGLARVQELELEHSRLVTILGMGGEAKEDDKTPADTVSRIMAERNAAEAVVEKHDKTRDGLPVVPDMKLFYVAAYKTGPHLVEATSNHIYARTEAGGGIQPDMCCSSPEAAEADFKKRTLSSESSAVNPPATKGMDDG